VKIPTRKSTQINNCSAKHMCDKSHPQIGKYWSYTCWFSSKSWFSSRIGQMKLHVIRVCNLTTSPQVVAL